MGGASCGARRWALLLALCLVSLDAAAGNRAGTPEDRARLFDKIVRLTLLREAFSPIKNERLELDFAHQVPALRDRFVAADTEAELLHALGRLSNARKDGHLYVEPVPGGLRYPDEPWSQAPLRFAVDYGTPGGWFLFVSDVDTGIAEHVPQGSPATRLPQPGDELLAINGLPIDRHLARMEPYIAYSTVERLWLEFAVNVSAKRVDFGPELYRSDVTYELRSPTGERYASTLPYLDPRSVEWAGKAIAERFDGVPHQSPQAFTWAGWANRKSYPGFRKVLQTESYRLHRLERDEARVLVLDWRSFKKEAYESDVDRLMEFAAANGLLDHDVICDMTTSRGGKRGWYLLQRLASRPFKVTLGNIRISDVTPRLVAKLADSDVARGPSGRWLLDWLQTDVREAVAAGRAYTRPVPFKLRALPRTSDGLLEPAAVHFRGRLVAVFGPLGRSQVDQWAAMFIDNGLGHSIGMPTAGSSNTWEWREKLRWDGGEPVADFNWSVGQTLRPNGEVLEGNPPRPVEPLSLTRDNFAAYYEEVLTRALRHLEAAAPAAAAGRR